MTFHCFCHQLELFCRVNRQGKSKAGLPKWTQRGTCIISTATRWWRCCREDFCTKWGAWGVSAQQRGCVPLVLRGCSPSQRTLQFTFWAAHSYKLVTHASVLYVRVNGATFFLVNWVFNVDINQVFWSGYCPYVQKELTLNCKGNCTLAQRLAYYSAYMTDSTLHKSCDVFLSSYATRNYFSPTSTTIPLKIAISN